MKLYRNWVINEVAKGMTKGDKTYVRTYKHTHIRNRPYVPSTTQRYVKLYRNLIINEVARVMTKVNIHTYVYTYETNLIYPSTTLLCEGIITMELLI